MKQPRFLASPRRRHRPDVGPVGPARAAHDDDLGQDFRSVGSIDGTWRLVTPPARAGRESSTSSSPAAASPGSSSPTAACIRGAEGRASLQRRRAYRERIDSVISDEYGWMVGGDGRFDARTRWRSLAPSRHRRERRACGSRSTRPGNASAEPFAGSSRLARLRARRRPTGPAVFRLRLVALVRSRRPRMPVTTPALKTVHPAVRTGGRAFTAEDLWAIPRVGAPAPAPDGTWAVVPGDDLRPGEERGEDAPVDGLRDRRRSSRAR